MQFLAMMRDGFREAMDARVFWVIGFVGMVLVALGATLSFQPLPLGKKVFATHVANLAGNSNSFRPPQMAEPAAGKDAEVAQEKGKEKGKEKEGEKESGKGAAKEVVRENNRRGPGRAMTASGPMGAFMSLFSKKEGEAELLESTPDQGVDGPESKWSLKVKVSSDLAKTRSKPDNTTLIRDLFGKVGEFSVFQVDSVTKQEKSDDPNSEVYLIEVSPLPGLLRTWPHKFSIFFGSVTIFDATNRPLMPFDGLGQQLLLIESYLVAGIGTWVCLLLSVALTAFFIPGMLRKGTIEPLLVRPISRWRLLLYKYLGCLLFVATGAVGILGSVWLVLSAHSGLWGYAFLGLIPVLIFYYAFLHSISTLGAVITRSAVFSLVIACICWLSLSILQGLYTMVITADQVNKAVEIAKTLERKAGEPEEKAIPLSQTYFGQTVLFLHQWLPRPGDIDSSVRELLEVDLLVGSKEKNGPDLMALIEGPHKPDWRESSAITAAYTALFLVLSCIIFTNRDP